MNSLQTEIERLTSAANTEQDAQARAKFFEFRDALTRGEIRAAEKINGQWTVNAWVKQGILLGFRLGELSTMGDAALSFVDKDTFPARQFAVADRVRVAVSRAAPEQGASRGGRAEPVVVVRADAARGIAESDVFELGRRRPLGDALIDGLLQQIQGASEGLVALLTAGETQNWIRLPPMFIHFMCCGLPN